MEYIYIIVAAIAVPTMWSLLSIVRNVIRSWGSTMNSVSEASRGRAEMWAREQKNSNMRDFKALDAVDDETVKAYEAMMKR
jgi:uncharacterized oligopeptide transporter (OPT) family protein